MILLDLNLEMLEKEMQNIGEKPFRAKQIFNWLIKETLFEDMRNLKGELKEKLRQNYQEGYLEEVKALTSTDGTMKFLLKLQDGHVIETVLIKREYGNTVCVSTQVGCRMGCVFCASCQKGFERNLSSGEILAQVIHANKLSTISNIVLMGIGEPLDNYENVLEFIKNVNSKDSLNIGIRNISLSTCGLTHEIIDLANENMQITLSISLHAPNDEKRIEIMPIAKTYSIVEIVKSARVYFEKTKRRIIIEYIMIDGFNDTDKDATELSTVLRGLSCHVNLIPLNDTGSLIKTPKNRQYAFLKMLENKNISATIRKSSGIDILGACGQLRHDEV